MLFRITLRLSRSAILAGLLLLAVPAPAAFGQVPGYGRPGVCEPPPAFGSPLPTTQPLPVGPGASQPSQGQPSATGMPTAQPLETAPGLGNEAFAALSGTSVAAPVPAAGYLDNPVPMTMFRLRYDAAYGDNRPDRAEFFYAKCGCFRVAGLDPHAHGPVGLETNVDYQDISAYFEYALSDRFSGFVQVPYRFLNPEVNQNTSGIADMFVGFKYAFLYCPEQVMSFQFKLWLPTGDAGRGLGNDLVGFEPSLLLYQKLSDRVSLQGQLGGWIPAGGTDFAGNILNYGAGLNYNLVDNGSVHIIPVVEVLGWTVLSGKELDGITSQTLSARGDTIINAKVGVRLGLGPTREPGNTGGSDLYIGYGRALTGDVWYKDILRVEYRLRF